MDKFSMPEGYYRKIPCKYAVGQTVVVVPSFTPMLGVVMEQPGKEVAGVGIENCYVVYPLVPKAFSFTLYLEHEISLPDADMIKGVLAQ